MRFQISDSILAPSPALSRSTGGGRWDFARFVLVARNALSGVVLQAELLSNPKEAPLDPPPTLFFAACRPLVCAVAAAGRWVRAGPGCAARCSAGQTCCKA